MTRRKPTEEEDGFSQLSLSDYVASARRPDDRPKRKPRRSLDERYVDWRLTRNGIAVFGTVEETTLELKRVGWKHYGIGAICEYVRFSHNLRVGPDAEGFVLNNSYRSRMAREIMDRNPELVGFFETRTLTSRSKS